MICFSHMALQMDVRRGCDIGVREKIPILKECGSHTGRVDNVECLTHTRVVLSNPAVNLGSVGISEEKYYSRT
jgi:hypothetical protein